jgi:hypothetical protein
VSLPVPLTVRIGDQRVTSQVQSLSFRREAVGGVRSISFTLARSLTDLDGMDPLAKVYVDDARTATTVAEGRLADTGRGAGPDGQRWDCVAFGPVQHASDVDAPLIYVDRRLDQWRQVERIHQEATIGTGPAPGDLATDPAQGIAAQFPDGLFVIGAGSSRLVVVNTVIAAATQKLARVRCNWDAGITDGNYEVLVITGVAGASTTIADSAPASTAGSAMSGVVVTDFANGHDSARLYFHRAVGNTTVVGDDTWAFFFDITIRAMQYAANGTEITTGYVTDSITVPEVVNDLLGRRLTEFDGANATVGITATALTQLAYPDGVTAEQVLEDLMSVEPTYRWYTTPSTLGSNGKYSFRWEPWPTTVRYEATLDDGGSFPLSAQSLFNVAVVTYTDASGRPWAAYTTAACPILDDLGIQRATTFSLGDQLGTEAAAVAAGQAFLAQHNTPKNSGTLNVARPIRDLISGRMVDPWEIEAGELIRIKGVEAYPDAFNADTNDGQGVFRIHAVDYTTEGNVSTLALDSDPRQTEDALVMLAKQAKKGKGKR